MSARASRPSGSDSETEERELEVVQNFFEGDRLLNVPARHSKRLLVLRYLAEQFKPGERYAESDVNWILGRFYADYALLRRLLVDEELLQRKAGVYWRAGSIPLP